MAPPDHPRDKMGQSNGRRFPNTPLGPTSDLKGRVQPSSTSDSMQQSESMTPRAAAAFRAVPPLRTDNIAGLPDASVANTAPPSARGGTQLTKRGNHGAPSESRFAGMKAPQTDDLVSEEEERLAKFHEAHLAQLRGSGVKPKDVRSMYKLTYGDDGSRTSSHIVKHLDQPVYGVNFTTGEFVPWAMNTAVVPLHMVSAFALAGTIVPKLTYSDLYSKYFKAITAVNDVIVTDLQEYTKSIKRIVEIHGQGAADFLIHFYAAHRIATKDRMSAKTFLRGWRDELIRAIKTREVAIAAEQDRRQVNAMTGIRISRNKAFEHESRLTTGEVERNEIAEDASGSDDSDSSDGE